MHAINFQLWLPLLALLLGGITHSLTDDGGASILDHFGIARRLPKYALVLAVLFFSTGSGFVDNVVGGQDLQHAAVTAFAALVTTIFGATTQHALVNKSPPKMPVVLLFAAALAVSNTACSWFQKNEALFPTPAQVACVLTEVEANDTDVVKVMTTCGIDKTLEQAVQILINGGLQAKGARFPDVPKDGGAR